MLQRVARRAYFANTNRVEMLRELLRLYFVTTGQISLEVLVYGQCDGPVVPESVLATKYYSLLSCGKTEPAQRNRNVGMGVFDVQRPECFLTLQHLENLMGFATVCGCCANLCRIGAVDVPKPVRFRFCKIAARPSAGSAQPRNTARRNCPEIVTRNLHR